MNEKNEFFGPMNEMDKNFCREQAEREQTDRQRIQKTEATLFPDGSSGEHSTLHSVTVQSGMQYIT